MEQKPKVVLGSDHAGFDLKERIREWICQNGYEDEDCGCFSQDPVHYPNLALAVAKKVVKERNSVGILICGTGIGMSITANKIKGIRAASCVTKFMARRAREHNNANVLCLGADVIDERCALSLVRTFLSTSFSEGERHIIRNRIIDEKSEKINEEIEREKMSKSSIPNSVPAGV